MTTKKAFFFLTQQHSYASEPKLIVTIYTRPAQAQSSKIPEWLGVWARKSTLAEELLGIDNHVDVRWSFL